MVNTNKNNNTCLLSTFIIVFLCNIIIVTFAQQNDMNDNNNNNNDHIHEQLTDVNYDEKTKGKVVFVKFYLPHCGHSLALVPVWDELESAYHLNSTHLVQRISCEDEHGRKNVKLCNYNAIKAYPTIKYGNPHDLKLYKGPYTLYAFKEFIENSLQVPCTPEYIEFCDDDKKDTMMHAMSLTEEQLQNSIEKEEKRIQNVTAEYELKLKELENKYEAVMTEQETAIENIKSGDLAVYRSVQVSGKENYKEILKSLILQKRNAGK